MKIAVATLESLSPYSPSKRVPTRNAKEDWHDYEERIWRSRIHADKNEQVFIPPMAFKRSIEVAAKYLKMRIPGKDRAEFGKHFLSGVLVVEGLFLPLKREEVDCEWLFLSSRGIRGGTDVEKCEPIIHNWSGDVTYHVLDDTIGKDVFAQHLTEAGSFIGVGRFRPEKGGYYGRYKVNAIRWQV